MDLFNSLWVSYTPIHLHSVKPGKLVRKPLCLEYPWIIEEIKFDFRGKREISSWISQEDQGSTVLYAVHPMVFCILFG